MWGVKITFFISRRGWSSGNGECSKTSRSAPPRWPDRRAAINAGSSTKPPLEVFIRTVPGFIAAIV